jgi:hypothetical protein
MSNIETADRLSRRRARMLPVLAVVFLAQQAAYFADPGDGRAVAQVRIGAWVVMGLVLLLALVTGGAFFRSAEVRALLNDEVTRANRARAFEAGFVSAMLSAMLLFCLRGALEFSVGEVIHLIVSAGMVSALVIFGMLERRAHR